MSFDAANIAASMRLDIPVLCADTCSILDVMRDPTRDTFTAPDSEAALGMIHAMERGSLLSLVAQQVRTELDEHLPHIAEEASKQVKETLQNSFLWLQ
ncbi:MULTISPECIES: hypothetical protein [unclassified Caballeronia]|uniref:hypothetical protein n=1 Tax=unclassified Caballeronia TaxID=2646786 RepID=UPI00285F40D5|nr:MULTISPECIES: hypothetical protein [unclassified Caballeronia]MDR5776848.1 hypothetical protein [Caballeronia sp. LZ002]MDR5798846.1 hypothetical protein [Caballeronia sp. LZ001]MDR5852367.1 hypothetical protein [Caballeronia sp. LZ003]